MICPKCNNEMDFGRTYIEGTLLVFLTFGLSYKHLYFKSNQSDTFETKILDNSAVRQAHYCNKCKTVVFESEA